MNESWSGAGHLWAIGYADVDRASQVKEEIIRLGWNEPYLFLSDVAVVVRHADGSFTLNREPFPTGANILGSTTVGFIVGLVLGVPLAGAAMGALLGGAATAREDRVYRRDPLSVGPAHSGRRCRARYMPTCPRTMS